MAKLLGKPEKIKVISNVKGIPLTITRNGKSGRITGIYKHWRVADEWWGEEVNRDYFTVKTSRGLACDIYHDLVNNLWYLSRIHD
jgi:hypothetical protein